MVEVRAEGFFVSRPQPSQTAPPNPLRGEEEPGGEATAVPSCTPPPKVSASQYPIKPQQREHTGINPSVAQAVAELAGKPASSKAR